MPETSANPFLYSGVKHNSQDAGTAARLALSENALDAFTETLNIVTDRVNTAERIVPLLWERLRAGTNAGDVRILVTKCGRLVCSALF